MEVVGVTQMFSSYTKIADTLQLEPDMGDIAPVDPTPAPGRRAAVSARAGSTAVASPPPENLSRAIDLWREAYRHQMAGELDRAVALYQESIRICPTAEAHTFLGWTYSFQGRLDEATARVPPGDRDRPRLRQPVQRHRRLPDAAGPARRGGAVAGEGQAGQALRAPAIPVHEPRAGSTSNRANGGMPCASSRPPCAPPPRTKAPPRPCIPSAAV